MKSDWTTTLLMSPSLFQSTLLVWRATFVSANIQTSIDFNPRSSYEERHLDKNVDTSTGISIHAPRMKSDENSNNQLIKDLISIHAPRMKSDRIKISYLEYWGFQSTLLVWRATATKKTPELTGVFQSTLLVWRATSFTGSNSLNVYFNPRSSYEERLWCSCFNAKIKHFNPRSSYEERPEWLHLERYS